MHEPCVQVVKAGQVFCNDLLCLGLTLGENYNFLVKPRFAVALLLWMFLGVVVYQALIFFDLMPVGECRPMSWIVPRRGTTYTLASSQALTYLLTVGCEIFNRISTSASVSTQFCRSLA